METDLFIFSIIVLIFSVIIHEVAHGWAANSLGDPTAKLAGRLTLNPIRHIDPVGTILIPLLLKLSGSPFLFGWAKPVPYNPYNLRNQRWGEAFVAVAGVATNLFLAILFGLLARYAYATGSIAFGDLAAVIVLMNLFLLSMDIPYCGAFYRIRVRWRFATSRTALCREVFLRSLSFSLCSAISLQNPSLRSFCTSSV